MTNNNELTIYELSLNVRLQLDAHSLSNAGSNGNRLLPRRQLLANGAEVDAISGNIQKHYHADILAAYMETVGISLCSACAARDGRRAAALLDQSGGRTLSISSILTQCGMCDTHGFLVTAKNSIEEEQAESDSIEKQPETKNKKSKKAVKVKVRDRW